MTEKFRNRYRVSSARLQTWDYGRAGAYFITICTYRQTHYFGEIVDGHMQLSAIGILADVFWHEIKGHSENVELGAFTVMPNHVHGILLLNQNDGGDRRDKACLLSTTTKTVGMRRFQNQGKNTVSSIIGGYKSAVSKHAHRLGYELKWQSRFHDHIIRNHESYCRIEEYVINNPVNWVNDKFYDGLP
jgi:putative transposase